MLQKKIAILLPDLRGGGVERIRLVLAQEFCSMGYQVEFVLVSAQGELLKEAKAFCPVVDLKSRRLREVPLKLLKYLQANKPDVLLVAMWPLTVMSTISCALSGYDGRVIVSEHNVLSIQYSNRSWVHRLALIVSVSIGYRLASGVVGVSQGVVKDLADLANMNVSRFRTIYNPLSSFQSPTKEAFTHAESFWTVPRGCRIITVGRFKSVKNQALLLRAFSKMPVTSNVQLMLLGDGELRNELTKLILDLGLSDRVLMPGFYSDPTPFYHSADLFVLTSNNEGFGNVIVEALAAGVPVISTNCPFGPAEILKNGEYGMLVPMNDENALAKAMCQSLESRHDAEHLRSRAKDFSPKSAAAAYLDLLQ